MKAETETQIIDSNATISGAPDGKSFLENSLSESIYQRLNKLHNSSGPNFLYLDKEEAELLTLELKGVRPPVAKHKSLKRLRRRSSADTQTVTVDGGPYPTRATCLLKYQYPKGIVFQSMFSVETEPKTTVSIDPVDGYLSPEGSAILHFKRPSPSASTGENKLQGIAYFRVQTNQIYYCKEGEAWLYCINRYYSKYPFERKFQDPTRKKAHLHVVASEHINVD